VTFLKLTFQCFIYFEELEKAVPIEEVEEEKKKHMVEVGTVKFMKELNMRVVEKK